MYSVRKVFIEISQNSQENTCESLFIKKEIRPETLLKRDWYRCFPVI